MSKKRIRKVIKHNRQSVINTLAQLQTNGSSQNYYSKQKCRTLCERKGRHRAFFYEINSRGVRIGGKVDISHLLPLIRYSTYVVHAKDGYGIVEYLIIAETPSYAVKKAKQLLKAMHPSSKKRDMSCRHLKVNDAAIDIVRAYMTAHDGR